MSSEGAQQLLRKGVAAQNTPNVMLVNVKHHHEEVLVKGKSNALCEIASKQEPLDLIVCNLQDRNFP